MRGIPERTRLGGLLVLVAICVPIAIAQQNVQLKPLIPSDGASAATSAPQPLTDAHIVAMVNAGKPESEVIAAMRTGPVKFDLSLRQMLALHSEGVSPRILNAITITELRQRRGISGAGGIHADELSPQPYPPKSRATAAGGANADKLSPQPYPPKGMLLTPGAEQTMLVGQATPLLDAGSKAAQPTAVERPAVADGAKQGTNMVSGTKQLAGGDPSSTQKVPGRQEYEAVTLDRGVTQDGKFGQWANNDQSNPKTVAPPQTSVSEGSPNTQKVPGRQEYQAITLDRGVTQDGKFGQWANNDQSNPKTVAPPQTTNQVTGPVAGSSLAAIERVPSGANVAVSTQCAKDPTRRILAVSEGSAAINTFKIGHQYAIAGCSFGAKLPSGVVYVFAGNNGFSFGWILFQVHSWNDNLIVFSTYPSDGDPSDPNSLVNYMNDTHESYIGPMPLYVSPNGSGYVVSDGYGISIN